MLALPDAPRIDEMSRKWLRFAERRLAYYNELYRSGRWQHYYSREIFAARVADVIKAVQVWRRLAGKNSANGKSDLRPAA